MCEPLLGKAKRYQGAGVERAKGSQREGERAAPAGRVWSGAWLTCRLLLWDKGSSSSFWLDSGCPFGNASVLCPAFACLCYSAAFSEDRSRLLPVVRNQECLRNQECRNRRVEEEVQRLAATFRRSWLSNQIHFGSRKDYPLHLLMQTHTHNTFLMLAFRSKEWCCDCRWFCSPFAAISALFFSAALCTDALCRRLWRCFGHLAL